MYMSVCDVLCRTVSYCVVLCRTVSYCVVPCRTVSYCVVLCRTVSYCVVLCRTVSYGVGAVRHLVRHCTTRRTSPTRRAPTPCTTLYDVSYAPDASGPDALYDAPTRRTVHFRQHSQIAPPGFWLTPHPPTHIRKFFLGKKMKFIKGARTWRSILGTQTFFWPLTHPPTLPSGIVSTSH